MRRFLFALGLVLVVAPLAAQQPPRRRVVPGEPSAMARVVMELDRQEASLRRLSAALKRDAFIVSKLVEATGDLRDFQRNSAIQEAIDHVNQAIRRAHQEPQASAQTKLALSSMKDDLEAARKQPMMADLAKLEKKMLERTRVVQFEMVQLLDDVRKERLALADILVRVTRVTSELDEGTNEALGATFSSFRAGGE